MTDTPRPRSTAISPVVFMGLGGPDLTAPESVERLAKSTERAMQKLLGVPFVDCEEAATLRALSAALEAEKNHKMAIAGDKIDAVSELRQVKARLKEAVDTAKQAIDVIASVQDYKQPDDPTEENALTMCEHEVFDFDVESARAFLASLEGDEP